MPKILFLSKYGPKAASTRYRFLQYFEFLGNHGFSCEFSELLSDKYLENKFTSGRSAIFEVLKGYLRRISLVFKLRKYDLVFVYSECLPFFPFFLERLLFLRGVRYIYDFDDAFFTTYENHPNPVIRFLLKNKISSLIKGASFIFAGNQYLAEYSRKINQAVEVIPTVVDLRKYAVKESGKDNRLFTIGWIGSPSTAGYLNEILPALRKFSAESQTEIFLVGVNKFDGQELNVRVKEWSLDSEAQDIKSFDIGIMPLPDTDWAKGKCAFKIIQYMACGLPVVASPVGANKYVVEDKINGFLASGSEEWASCFKRLFLDKKLRFSMGSAGRVRVKESFSLEVMQPKVLAILKNLMKEKICAE